MALQDLYGIGKGEAQVFDNQPLLDLLAEERAANRKRNAEELAKKATKAAALNALDEKLAVEGYDKHTKFLQDKLYGLKDWAKNMYAKHGENVFAENPALASEWKDKTDDFVRYNTWSKNLIGSAKEQQTRALKSQDDIDENSLKAYNDYWNLPPEEQYKQSMPLIRDRELVLDEIVQKDWLEEIKKVTKPFGYTGKEDDKGNVLDYKGIKIDEAKYDELIKQMTTNPDSRWFRRASKEAAEEINTQAIPQYKNGELNPDYVNELNKIISEKATGQVNRLIEPTYTESHKRSMGGSGKEKPQTTLAEVKKSEGGLNLKQPLDKIKNNPVINKVIRDAGGNLYFQTKVDMYRVPDKNGGYKYNTKEELIKANLDPKKYTDILPAGGYYNRDWEQIEGKDLGNLLKGGTEISKINRVQTGDTYSVAHGVTSDFVGVDYYIGTDGEKVKANLTQGYKDANIEQIVIGAKFNQVEKGDGKVKFVFEGEKGFNPDAEVFTEDFATIRRKGSKEFLVTPITDEMKNKDPKFKSEYEKVKAGGVSEADELGL